MSNAWEQILASHPDVDPELLRAYLEGSLSEEDRHRVERMMTESAFVSDAMDGLTAIPDPARVSGIVSELNQGLRRRTRERRRKRFLGSIGFPGWLAFATALVILLITLAWLVLRIWHGPRL